MSEYTFVTFIFFLAMNINLFKIRPIWTSSGIFSNLFYTSNRCQIDIKYISNRYLEKTSFRHHICIIYASFMHQTYASFMHHLYSIYASFIHQIYASFMHHLCINYTSNLCNIYELFIQMPLIHFKQTLDKRPVFQGVYLLSIFL